MDLMSKLGFGAQVMLIGVVIVFAGLVILIACIKLMSAIISLKKKPAPTPAPAPAPVVEAVQDAAPAEDQDELIAVITAVLAACADSGKTLAIRSVRRAPGKTPAWARAGREDQLANRF